MSAYGDEHPGIDSELWRLLLMLNGWRSRATMGGFERHPAFTQLSIMAVIRKDLAVSYAEDCGSPNLSFAPVWLPNVAQDARVTVI